MVGGENVIQKTSRSVFDTIALSMFVRGPCHIFHSCKGGSVEWSTLTPWLYPPSPTMASGTDSGWLGGVTIGQARTRFHIDTYAGKGISIKMRWTDLVGFM